MKQPTEKQLNALRVVAEVEAGITRYINLGDIEECADQDWVEPQPNGRYLLTSVGRRILEDFSDRSPT